MAAAALTLAFAVFSPDALACIAYQPFDPEQTLQHHAREEIVAAPEVIVEGVVEPYEPAANEAGGSNDATGFTRMRVDRVWKGDVAPTVVLVFQTSSSDCSRPPPFGQRIRFSAYPLEKNRLLSREALALTPQRRALLEAHRDVLYYGRVATGLPFDLPLQDTELDRMLVAYQTKTEALSRQAASGGKEQKLAFARHLEANNEMHRALNVYQGISQDDPDDLELLLALAVVQAKAHRRDEAEATFAEVERRAPQTEGWRGKIIRTRFAATGKFTPGWKDWTGLKPTRSCESRGMNFDGASFDRADLAGCDFRGSSFRQASFLAADMSEADLGDSAQANLSGAKYDCSTRLPKWIDPVAVGMINIEGECRAP